MSRKDAAEQALLSLHALLTEAAGRAPRQTDEPGAHPLPLALTALHALGAPAARLQACAAAWQLQGRPATAPAPWPVGDAWPPLLGQAAAWPRYRGLFRTWLQHEGAQDVLNQVLPRLLAGSAAGGFHGLLRTAQGVRAGHAGEVAEGLAAWAATHTPLGAPLDPLLGTVLSPPGDDADLARVLRRLQRAAGGARAPEGLSMPGLQAAAAAPGFDAAVQRLALTLAPAAPTDRRALEAAADPVLQPLARTAAALLARHGRPELAVLVTVPLALRRLLPLVDDPQAALRGAWRAWAAAFVASGVPLPRGAIPGAGPGDAPDQSRDAPSWRPLLPRARASDDAGVLMLAAACREAESLWGGTVWRAALSRALGPGA